MAAMETVIRYQLDVPTTADGVEYHVPANVAETVRFQLTSGFGGCFVSSGEGSWAGEDQHYCEPILRFTVDVPGDGDDVNAEASIKEIAAYVKARLKQEAVYLTRTTIERELV